MVNQAGHSPVAASAVQLTSTFFSDWSVCSQPCGATGVQVRGTQCVLRKGTHSKTVHSDLCQETGLQQPSSLRECRVECARWETSSWSEVRLSWSHVTTLSEARLPRPVLWLRCQPLGVKVSRGSL